MFLDDAGQAAAGNHADPPAHFLDGDHERQREQHRPELAVAELGAGLRISADARGIVVRGAGDEAGPKELQQLADGS